MNNVVIAKPFLKWAGGKHKLAPVIEELLLKKTDMTQIKTYIEPFIGGGAFFFYLCEKYQFSDKVIMDINQELINLYTSIQQDVYGLLARLDVLQLEYNSLETIEDKSAHFYNIRVKYNETIYNENVNLLEQGSYFIYLNKIGFNGLYRVNKKGFYNVPFGQRKEAVLYNMENMVAVSEVLKDTTIMCGDYKLSKQFANKNSLFYFDPPYRPLSNSSSFNSYAKSEFNDDTQIELAKFCHEIIKEEAHFILSNSDPKNVSSEDEFFDELYSNYTIERLSVRRMIGAKSSSRTNVSEILVIK